MATKRSPKPAKRMGRPETVGVAKVLKIGVDDDVLARMAVVRALVEQILPGSALSDSALGRHILLKGLEAYEKATPKLHPELPLLEPTTKKS